jgi:hypothetical protein
LRNDLAISSNENTRLLAQNYLLIEENKAIQNNLNTALARNERLVAESAQISKGNKIFINKNYNFKNFKLHKS